MDQKLKRLERVIVVAYADNNMNIAETAKALNYHRNSIAYHLDQIHKRTGINPKNFYDLVRLIDHIRETDSGEPS